MLLYCQFNILYNKQHISYDRLTHWQQFKFHIRYSLHLSIYKYHYFSSKFDWKYFPWEKKFRSQIYGEYQKQNSLLYKQRENISLHHRHSIHINPPHNHPPVNVMQPPSWLWILPLEKSMLMTVVRAHAHPNSRPIKKTFQANVCLTETFRTIHEFFYMLNIPVFIFVVLSVCKAENPICRK